MICANTNRSFFSICRTRLCQVQVKKNKSTKYKTESKKKQKRRSKWIEDDRNKDWLH